MRTTGALDIQKKKQQPHQDIFLNKKIVAPEKLKILVLSGNDIISQQLEFLHKCTNLLKLDLSNNHITRIAPKLGLEKLTKLEILYLHNNKIESAVGLEGVFSLEKLTHLTIRDNPVERLPRIQHLIVNVMPSLKVIGDRIVFVEERSPTFIEMRSNVFIEAEISEGWKVKDNSEAQYIKILQFQLRYFDYVWVHNNPIVRIQRAWRVALKNKRKKRVHQRRKINNKNEEMQIPSESSQILSIMKEFFLEWKNFAQNRRTIKRQLQNTSSYPQDKVFLTYPLKQYHQAMRNLRVQKVVKAYVAYIRNRIFVRKMAERLYRQLKKKSIEFNSPQSFYTLCKVDVSHRFYFNKIQTHLLENFLIHMEANFHWKGLKETIKIGPVTHYLSIRTVDPQTFSVKTIYSTFTYTIWPSMRAIFLKKKKFESKQKTGYIKIKPLYYIKNRNKVLTKEEFKKTTKVYKQLEKFYKKQYQNSLDYFQCKNEQVMKMLLRYIYYHNSKSKKFQKKTNKNDMQSLLENYEQPFMIYADCILQRTAAAVRIQQNWRKYLVHKNSKESIYAKMKKTRAVLRIQRFWRDHVFYHRLSFQRNISYHLKLFNSNSFMLPCQVYLKFKEICREEEQNELYDGLSLYKSPKPRQLITPIWIYGKPVYSPSISRLFFPNIAQQLNAPSQQSHCDCWNILHADSTATKIEYANRQFYEFKFANAEEARYRMFLIALLSYRCKGSTFFLPVSKDTLDLLSLRFEEYERMELLNKSEAWAEEKKARSKGSLRIKEDQFMANAMKKISVLRLLGQSGVFLSSNTDNLQQPLKYPINIEFYQKAFQDFPKKYTSNLYYALTDQIQKQKLLEKEKQLEQLVQQKYIEEEEGLKLQAARQAAKSNIDGIKQQTYINVTKIDKKRLSMYDFGGTGSGIRKNDEKPKTRGQSFFEEALNKKQNLSRIKMEETTRKQENVQKKSENLKKLREDVEKERSMIATTKNLKEFQRTEELKRKVQRVKQMKNRVSSLRKEDHEQDFIQQGNFVMQQQLKMVIMRSKIQSIKPRVRQRDRSETSSKKDDSYSKSFFTEQRNKEIKVYDNQNTRPIAQSLGATLAMNNPTEQTVTGEERKIVNIRSQRRNKSRSIGAYLRDPSLVHGVFPEEYYPIESRQGGAFKFFPPLL